MADTNPTPSPNRPGSETAVAGKPKSLLRDYLEQGLITVIMALFLMTFIAQAVAVPTGSMQNTINIGDHLFVNKFIFGSATPVIGKLLPTREIRRGDIIVFKLPSDPKVNYVKRVIGLPGEQVLVRGRRVLINGKDLPEERVTVKLTGDYSNRSALEVVRTDPAPSDAWYKVYYSERNDEEEAEMGGFHDMRYAVDEPFLIPANSYFVMGDSRDNSLDSRYWGVVPRENIFARALYVHWSFNPRDPEVTSNDSSLPGILRAAKLGRIGSAVK
ncbi:MAG: signal peptidase I [Blastocatellia bacterium]